MYNEAQDTALHTPMITLKKEKTKECQPPYTGKEQKKWEHSGTVGGNVLQSLKKTKVNRNLHSWAVLQDKCRMRLHKNLYMNAHSS